MANGNGNGNSEAMHAFWRHVGRVLNPTTLFAILVQTVILVWWLSSFSTATSFQIADLTHRMIVVEDNQRQGLIKYAEIREFLGKLSGQNESILAMLRDLQGDRRLRRDGSP